MPRTWKGSQLHPSLRDGRLLSWPEVSPGQASSRLCLLPSPASLQRPPRPSVTGSSLLTHRKGGLSRQTTGPSHLGQTGPVRLCPLTRLGEWLVGLQAALYIMLPASLFWYTLKSNPKEMQYQRMLKLWHNCTHLTH